MTRTLIRGGCVLTMAKTNFTEADVLIEDGTIVEVGPRLRARDSQVVEATDTIVMPGFVDTHRHAWESLFRNLGGDASRADYGPQLEPEDVYAATLLGLLGAVDAGITTVVDWCELASNTSRLEAVLQAHSDSGIRSVLALGKAEWAGSGWQAQLAATQSQQPRLTFAAGPGDLRRNDLETTLSDWAAARALGLRVHVHAGQTSSDQGLVAELSAGHHLGGDVTLVHCTNLSDSDLSAIASSGAFVALTPQAEMSSGRGSPPVQRLIDRGIRPGLGIDSERVASGDIFAQMRAAISLQHAVLFDQKLAGKAGLPRLLTTREVIRFATVDGAQAIGLGGTAGSLEAGRAADVIVLRTDRANIFPINDPIGAVVWGMDTSNVDSVFVGGRALKREGQLVGDVDRARSLAITARERVGRATGLLVTTGGGA